MNNDDASKEITEIAQKLYNTYSIDGPYWKEIHRLFAIAQELADAHTK